MIRRPTIAMVHSSITIQYIVYYIQYYCINIAAPGTLIKDYLDSCKMLLM